MTRGAMMTRRRQIRLPAGLDQRLEAEASARGETVSDIIRFVLTATFFSPTDVSTTSLHVTKDRQGESEAVA